MIFEDPKINKYLEGLRRKNSNTFQMFEKNLDFMISIQTDIGKSLLDDLIRRHEHCFFRIASTEATDAEKQTFLYLKSMIEAWARKIADFVKHREEYKEN
jgi:hypothetical protein